MKNTIVITIPKYHVFDWVSFAKDSEDSKLSRGTFYTVSTHLVPQQCETNTSSSFIHGVFTLFLRSMDVFSYTNPSRVYKYTYK
ncbi:hypothetical protein CEXT_740831 [Caerostris extrusa]|uniref:Uncharacterized protein n=1 Tax=Caerostris extrusa TaxID=172846 RepID=A0AAV4XEV6_CAEEX|nr:hypothetical protein CEXT_740831 [Caerostris extrusa]